MDANGTHPQREANGSSFNNFIDGMQAYVSDANVSTSEPQFDFTGWDPNLFHSNDQPASSFSQSTPSFQQDYNQNDHHTTQSAMLSPYGGMQSSISQAQYGQAYENGRPPQAPFDPRTISQPTPSPGPYPAYQFQPNINYGSRDQMMPSSSFSMNAGLLQPRPSSTTGQGMQHQGPHSPYFGYNPPPLNQPRYQGPELGHFSGFPEQPQQPTNTYINPSMLTANGVSVNGTAASQFQSWQPPHNAAYATSLSARDPRGRPLAPVLMPAGAQPPTFQTGVLIPTNLAKTVSKFKGPKDPNAPKGARGRPRKDGDMPRPQQNGPSSGSVSATDSSDESDFEEEEPETTPAMLSVSPPKEPLARAIYDAVKAIWSPRNKPAPPEKIKEGLLLFGNTVKQVRDAWKVKNEALKEANNAGDLKTIPVLTEEVKRYRNAMEGVLKRTLLFGHETIIKNLPKNVVTIAVLYSFLLDRVNNDDFNGGLVISIFKLIARFTLLDEEELERVKMIKILQRWVKKGGPESKHLAQTILDNAKAATAKNKLEGAPASPSTVNGLTSTGQKATALALARKQENVAGVKRTSDGEVSGQPLKKAAVTRPVVQASKPLALQQAEKRRLETAKQGKVEKASSSAPAATASTVAKPRTVVPVPLKATSSVFQSLASASKKPGTSNAARAAAAKDGPAVANSNVKKDSSSSSASVLAEVPAVAKPSFSFMDELGRMDKPKEVKEDKVEEHPNETEEQRKRRLRKESRRKLRVTWKPESTLLEIRLFTHDPAEEVGHADSMRRDVDDVGGEGRMLKLHKGLEDLEDEDETEEELESYVVPTEVDFGELDAEERSRNFIKMGGTLSPESPSAVAQAKHEENSLMVIYALPSDMPSTPREPPDSNDEDDYQPETAFGEPPERTRRREAEYSATKPPPPPGINPAIDLSSLLQKMQQVQPAQVPQYAQQHVTPTPPLPQVAPGVDLNKLLAITNALKAQQPQQGQYPQQPTVTPAVQPNLATLMASLTGQQPKALPLGLAGNPNPYPGSDTDVSRKHSRHDNGSADLDDDYRSKNKKKKPTTPTSSDKPYNYKTMVCTFWQVGKCMKGDNCTYRHDES